MVLERGVPYERLAVELESRYPVAEAVDRAGRRGANGGPELPEAAPSCGR